MVNIIATASELGYIKIPKNTLIETDQIKNYPDDQIVLINEREARERQWQHYPVWQTQLTEKYPSYQVIRSYSAQVQFQGNEEVQLKIMNELALKVHRSYLKIHMFPVMHAVKN